MDDSVQFKEKIMAMYESRQEFGCPTMKCPSLQEAIIKESAVTAYELCLSVSALLLLNNIEISPKTLDDMATLVSRSLVKHSAKCAVTSHEVCQACAMSKLMDKKDIQ